MATEMKDEGTDPDDEMLTGGTPQDIIDMLGFDPCELNMLGFDYGALDEEEVTSSP